MSVCVLFLVSPMVHGSISLETPPNPHPSGTSLGTRYTQPIEKGKMIINSGSIIPWLVLCMHAVATYNLSS